MFALGLSTLALAGPAFLVAVGTMSGPADTSRASQVGWGIAVAALWLAIVAAGLVRTSELRRADGRGPKPPIKRLTYALLAVLVLVLCGYGACVAALVVACLARRRLLWLVAAATFALTVPVMYVLVTSNANPGSAPMPLVCEALLWWGPALLLFALATRARSA